MTYQETLDWMFSQLPMYQRQGKTAFKKDLTNISAFCDVLKNPQNKFASIHVGGTNGKGSTSHIISSILQEAGYKVGLYTSPHLKNFTERIRINGEEVSQHFVVDFITKNKHFLETQQLSFFEMTVGLAFAYFATQNVDIADHRSWFRRAFRFYKYHTPRSSCYYKYWIRSYAVFRRYLT